VTPDDAVAEIHWIAREALALGTEHVDQHSQRWTDYNTRKRALMEYIEGRL